MTINLYTKRNYYTYEEIEKHNLSSDCWVILFENILDLTNLISENYNNELIKPLIDFAGKNITHWFNNKNMQPKTKIDLKTGRKVYYCPNGRYLHIPEYYPDNNTLLNSIPWWNNKKYIIGKITKNERKLRIINMLSNSEDIIKVAEEDSINEILDRYKLINEHANSYTWKSIDNKPLDMKKTLDENEIIDNSQEFKNFMIPENLWFYPSILIFFNDDLTEA